MSWNEDNTVWNPYGATNQAKLEHLGNGQWRFTSKSISETIEKDGGTDVDYKGRLTILWEPDALIEYFDEDLEKQSGTYTFSGNGPATIRIGYSYPWADGGFGTPGLYTFTEETISNGLTDNRGNNGSYGTSDENFGINIPEVNPDNPLSCGATPATPSSGAQVHFTGRRALTTYSSGTNAAKIFEPTTNHCNLVGLGDYPNTSSISNALGSTLDAIAIDAGVRLIIYSGANYSGSVILDVVGPKVIYNDYHMKYNEQDDDGNQGHGGYIGMMLDEPHEGTWDNLPLVNQLSELMTGWDTTVMDPSGSGQTLSERFPSPTGNVNGIDGARIRSYEIGYAPSVRDSPMRPGARMDNWQIGSFKICLAAAASGSNGAAPSSIIKMNVSGGTNPMQYSIGGSTYQDSNIFNVNLSPGNYMAYAKDAMNCLVTHPFTIGGTASATPTSPAPSTNLLETPIWTGRTPLCMRLSYETTHVDFVDGAWEGKPLTERTVGHSLSNSMMNDHGNDWSIDGDGLCLPLNTARTGRTSGLTIYADGSDLDATTLLSKLNSNFNKFDQGTGVGSSGSISLSWSDAVVESGKLTSLSLSGFDQGPELIAYGAVNMRKANPYFWLLLGSNGEVYKASLRPNQLYSNISGGFLLKYRNNTFSPYQITGFYDYNWSPTAPESIYYTLDEFFTLFRSANNLDSSVTFGIVAAYAKSPMTTETESDDE